MKHITKRFLSLVLVVFMLTSLVGTVSAATVSWTANGYSYTATVSAGSARTKNFALPETRAYHTKGSTTIFSATASNGTTAYAATSEFPYEFTSYLTEALENTSPLRWTRNVTISGTVYTSVGEGEASGYYKMYAKVPGNYASWWVDKTNIETIDSGTLSYAPNSDPVREYVALP